MRGPSGIASISLSAGGQGSARRRDHRRPERDGQVAGRDGFRAGDRHRFSIDNDPAAVTYGQQGDTDTAGNRNLNRAGPRSVDDGPTGNDNFSGAVEVEIATGVPTTRPDASAT